VAVAHWLCIVHRKELGAAVARDVTEAELLRTLVFTFPPSCPVHEFSARALYAAGIWNARDKAAAVLRAHGLRGKVRVRRGVTPLDVTAMCTAFAEFVCAHIHVAPRELGAACVARVRAWYPVLAPCASTRGEMLEAERMLHAVERATGVREFLVLADVARALTVVPPNVAEVVYAAYVKGLSDPAACVKWGAEWCT
jgi:hypothetical protein